MKAPTPFRRCLHRRSEAHPPRPISTRFLPDLSPGLNVITRRRSGLHVQPPADRRVDARPGNLRRVSTEQESSRFDDDDMAGWCSTRLGEDSKASPCRQSSAASHRRANPGWSQTDRRLLRTSDPPRWPHPGSEPTAGHHSVRQGAMDHREAILSSDLGSTRATTATAFASTSRRSQQSAARIW